MRGFLLVAALTMAAATSVADIGLSGARPVSRVYRVKIDMRTGDVQRVDGAATQLRGRTILWDNSTNTGFFAPMDLIFSTQVMTEYWGDIASTDPNMTVVGSFQFAYATDSQSPNRPMLDLGFYGNSDADLIPFPIAVFRFLNLPNVLDVNGPPPGPNQGVGFIVDVNLAPNAPLVLTGPNRIDPNRAPTFPLPECNTLASVFDFNAPTYNVDCGLFFSQWLRWACLDRSGLRDFGYTIDFRDNAGATGGIWAVPDPNMVRAGQCPAPGYDWVFNAYFPCDPNLGDPNCVPPAPNDPLVIGTNTSPPNGPFVLIFVDAAGNQTGWLPGQPWLVLRSTVGGGGGGCPEDLNGDGQRDLADLSVLLSNFGLPGGPADGDINGDGMVDLSDLSALLAVFGLPCP